jgi:hypothetical protein
VPPRVFWRRHDVEADHLQAPRSNQDAQRVLVSAIMCVCVCTPPARDSSTGTCARQRTPRTLSERHTFCAPRSTSISTRRMPTKPVPPVTTHTLGTGGCDFCRPRGRRVSADETRGQHSTKAQGKKSGYKTAKAPLRPGAAARNWTAQTLPPSPRTRTTLWGNLMNYKRA